MTAVYAIGQAIRLRAWQAVALAPVNDWGRAWRLLAAGSMLRAGLLVAPVAVPAGLAIAAALWAWRIYAITTGLAGQTASAPITFDTRQWRRQARAARGRAAAPGTVPLLGRGGLVVIGPVIRAIRHRWRPVLAVPYRSFGRHAVIIGSSGSGKTNLMMRLWAGWYAAARTAYARRDGDRPLLVVLDSRAARTPASKQSLGLAAWGSRETVAGGSCGWSRAGVAGDRVCCPCACLRRDRFQGGGCQAGLAVWGTVRPARSAVKMRRAGREGGHDRHVLPVTPYFPWCPRARKSVSALGAIMPAGYCRFEHAD